MTDAERERAAVVAKGLTRAQRDMLLFARKSVGMDGRALGPWPHEATRKALVGRGLVFGTTLTPLGLAVRELLRDGGDA